MAVQNVTPPRLSPAGQTEEESDHENNHSLSSTFNSQADDRQEAVPSRRDATPVASSHPHMAPGRLRLPQFLKNDPDFCFTQVEARFHIHNIDSHEDRFCPILAAIEESNFLAQVSDFILNQSAQDTFQLSRLNSSHALLIPKSINVTEC
jgi:hypothetical protein